MAFEALYPSSSVAKIQRLAAVGSLTEGVAAATTTEAISPSPEEGPAAQTTDGGKTQRISSSGRGRGGQRRGRGFTS
jgi:hypothetical protein